jgi:hypothetical protein
MNEQEAKDAAIQDARQDFNFSDSTIIEIVNNTWEAAMKYPRQDSAAAVVVKNFNKETLNIAAESIERLQAENQRYREALEHYANPHNWEYRDDPDEDLNVLCVYVGEFENIECTTGDKIALAALGGE